MTEASEEIKIAPKGMSTEKMRREAQREKGPVPTRISRDVEAGMERFSEKVRLKYQERVSETVGSLLQLQGAFERVPEAMSGIDSSMKGWHDIQRRQLSEIEAQTPSELRVPSKERMAREKLNAEGKRGLTMSDIEEEAKKIEDKELKTYASGWFEQRIRHLESFDLAFEEQPTLMNPLVLAVTQYELDPEMKELGEVFRNKLEARRKRQRLVRIWGIQTPDRISAEASSVDNAVLKELFTEGGKSVEEAFHHYEKMGGALKDSSEQIEALHKQKKQLSGTEKKKKKEELEEKIEKLEDNRDDRIKAIQDFNNHGGYVTDEGEIVEIDEIIRVPSRVEGSYIYLDEYLAGLEKKEKEGGKTAEVEKLRETLWARRFSGGLWSITLRAGYFNVTLNGLGDVFASRALNISENVSKRGLLRKTEGVWGPEGGTPFDLGYTDYFTKVLAGAKEQRQSGKGVKGDLHRDWLETTAGITEDQYETSQVEVKTSEGKKKITKLDSVKTLQSAKLADEGFWNDLEDQYGAEAAYSTHLDNFRKADETRARFWGTDSFFHNPDRYKLVKLTEVFDHVPETMVDLVDLKGNEIELDGKKLRATEREQKWQELLERTIVWMKEDNNAKELVETLNVYPDAEIFGWIEDASVAEMITNQQADYLFKEYLNFPLVGGDPKGKARLRATISVVTAPFRYPQARQYLAFGTLMELLKRGFAYVFSDEVGRR